jgi:hypothetical protein
MRLLAVRPIRREDGCIRVLRPYPDPGRVRESALRRPRLAPFAAVPERFEARAGCFVDPVRSLAALAMAVSTQALRLIPEAAACVAAAR